MKAALLAAIRQPFVVEDIDFLDPAPGRVLVRTGRLPVLLNRLCQLARRSVQDPADDPRARLDGRGPEVGPGVTQIAAGDRVIVPGTSECGVCFYCSIGRPDQCSETCDRGGIWPHVANRHSGEPVSAAGNVGGYAEVMNVTASQVFPVETDLPDEWLSLLGCGITTGVGCVLNIARLQPGSSIAIFGLGHLGQWMVQAARIAGARRIIAVDPISWRRELAGRFGATHVVDPDAEDPVAAVKALTDGRGADVTMEAATLASVYAPTIRAARRAGTVVLTSVETGLAEVTVPQLALSVEGRTIEGAQNGRVRMRSDLPRFIRMMEDGLLDPEPIITTRYPLERIDDALHASAEQRDLSGVIVPSLPA